MKRRQAIQYLLVIAGGTAVLPSCLHKQSKASLLLKNIRISGDEEAMLAEFAETLIPASATPGAKDTYAHLFVLRMMDDCFDKEAQKKFTGGLAAVNKMAQQAYHTSFVQATPAQRAEIVAALEAKKAPEAAVQFYTVMKNLTIQGYLTSRPVLGDIFHYELVPGRYNGAFPVKTIFHQA